MKYTRTIPDDSTMETTVTVEHYDANKPLQYVGSTSKEVNWQTFTSGNTLTKPNVTADWYLHIQATGFKSTIIKFGRLFCILIYS